MTGKPHSGMEIILMKSMDPFYRFFVKRCLVLSALALILFSSHATAQNPANSPPVPAKEYQRLKFPKLRDIQIPEPARFVLENGMIVYLMEDHELPVFNVTARIRTGSRWEPAEKVGLAEITGAVMRTGGTVSRTGDSLDDELENIGASVEVSIGQTAGYAGAGSLKEDSDRTLTILADVLMHPAFREDKIELAKIQIKDAIARRNDDVSTIADREFARLIYGADSPYARYPEHTTVDAIRREDLLAFHRRYFAPNNIILGAWGDFRIDEMKAKIEQAFKDWKSRPLDLPPLPSVSKEPRNGVYYVRKDDVTQTNIRIGQMGGQYNDPDFYALTLLGSVLGEGFSSRIFKNVRSTLGLAYAAYGSWGADYDHPGIFLIGGETQTKTTARAVKAFLAELQQLTEKEVTNEELQLAKDVALNSFIFNFDTKGKILSRILNYEYYGYPKDFLQRYKQNIEKVTRADILRAARTRLHPDKVTILAVGQDPKLYDQPLSTLGSVKTLDITIPGPSPSPKAGASR